MSSGFAEEETAACIVRARSAAEIPVVTPSAASIETVKLVLNFASLRSDMSGSANC